MGKKAASWVGFGATPLDYELRSCGHSYQASRQYQLYTSPVISKASYVDKGRQNEIEKPSTLSVHASNIRIYINVHRIVYCYPMASITKDSRSSIV